MQGDGPAATSETSKTEVKLPVNKQIVWRFLLHNTLNVLFADVRQYGHMHVHAIKY